MQPLTSDDILDIARYELDRAQFRARIIELKKRRRVQVGDLITIVFENRDTVRFQIQEMMRAERIVTADRIQEEIDIYNDLIPGPNMLSATLLVEITDQQRLREILDRFIGIDRGGSTFLLIGADRIEATYEGGHSKEDRVSAVHHITFLLTEANVTALKNGEAPASLEIRHRNYTATVGLTTDTCMSLTEDLGQN